MISVTLVWQKYCCKQQYSHDFPMNMLYVMIFIAVFLSGVVLTTDCERV